MFVKVEVSEIGRMSIFISVRTFLFWIAITSVNVQNVRLLRAYCRSLTGMWFICIHLLYNFLICNICSRFSKEHSCGKILDSFKSHKLCCIYHTLRCHTGSGLQHWESYSFHIVYNGKSSMRKNENWLFINQTMVISAIMIRFFSNISHNSDRHFIILTKSRWPWHPLYIFNGLEDLVIYRHG
jgi:hypothetical protein